MSVNEQGDFVLDSFCSTLTTDEARELAETLSGHSGRGLTKWGLTYRLAEPVIESVIEDLAPSLEIEPSPARPDARPSGADEREDATHDGFARPSGARPRSR